MTRPSAPETANPVRRRGRPPLPPDNSTRERLLDAAAQLLAERNYSQVSVREITEAAGQSLGALNYHFGSKEGLLAALVRRAAPALIDERAKLLHDAELLHDRSARLRAVLHALIAPVIRWSREPATQQRHLPMLNRLRVDCPAELRALVEVDVKHLRPFAQALKCLLPGWSEAEVGWYLHFVLGIEHSIVSEPARLAALVGHSADIDDPESITQRVLDFVLPGWMAKGVDPPR